MARKPVERIEPITTSDDTSVASNDIGSPVADAGAIFDPAAVATANANDGSDGSEFARNADGSIKRNADGSPAKRRGRKPGGSGTGSGTSNSSPRKAPAVNLGGVEAILFSLHAMAAASFSVPEIALDKKEAEQLAIAVAAVADHYPVSIAPKTMAWVNLVMACGAIYGPRVYNYKKRIDKENDEKRQENNSPFVSSFSGLNAVS